MGFAKCVCCCRHTGGAGDFEPDPETRERATVVAGTIRTDGATAAAKLLLDWSR
jgi:hypothetical protein